MDIHNPYKVSNITALLCFLSLFVFLRHRSTYVLLWLLQPAEAPPADPLWYLLSLPSLASARSSSPAHSRLGIFPLVPPTWSYLLYLSLFLPGPILCGFPCLPTSCLLSPAASLHPHFSYNIGPLPLVEFLVIPPYSLTAHPLVLCHKHLSASWSLLLHPWNSHQVGNFLSQLWPPTSICLGLSTKDIYWLPFLLPLQAISGFSLQSHSFSFWLSFGAYRRFPHIMFYFMTLSLSPGTQILSLPFVLSTDQWTNLVHLISKFSQIATASATNKLITVSF